MKKTDNILRIFLYLSLLAVGGVVGISVGHMKGITISQEINIIDMATLVVTIFLAVYIPAVLDRRLQSSKEKQDILIARINDYQTLQRRINMLVQSVNNQTISEHLSIQNLLDVSQHKFMTFVSLMNNANLNGKFDKALADIQLLDRQHKELLWSDKMSDTGFSYSTEVKQREEELYNKIDEATSLLIFAINDAK